jgi:hypothetical protein
VNCLSTLTCKFVVGVEYVEDCLLLELWVCVRDVVRLFTGHLKVYATEIC